MEPVRGVAGTTPPYVLIVNRIFGAQRLLTGPMLSRTEAFFAALSARVWPGPYSASGTPCPAPTFS
jgi:hypothetical protein